VLAGSPSRDYAFWMHPIPRLLLALLSVSILAACATNRPQFHVNNGPIHAKTYSYVRTKNDPNDIADDRAAIHARIQRAIDRSLGSHGLAKVDRGGELTVAYLVIVGNNVTTTSLNQFFGYGRSSIELVDEVHRNNTTNGGSANYFEEGTLVIDLIDTGTSKVLKRVTVRRPILEHATDAQRDAHVQEAVDEALAGVSAGR